MFVLWVLVLMIFVVNIWYYEGIYDFDTAETSDVNPKFHITHTALEFGYLLAADGSLFSWIFCFKGFCSIIAKKINHDGRI